MKEYVNDRQELRMEVVESVVIALAVALTISYIFYLIPFDLLLIFSILKAVIFLILLKYILHTFKMHDWRYCISIGIISFFILFLFPHFMLYNELVKNEIELRSLNDYIDVVGEITEVTTYPFMSKSGGVFSFIIFELIRAVILFLLVVTGSYATGLLPFSKKSDKFYNELFKVRYNKFKDDILERPEELKKFTSILNLLNNVNRFKSVENSQKNEFVLFGLPNERNRVIRINAKYLPKYFILDSNEFNSIKKVIYDSFHVKLN